MTLCAGGQDDSSLDATALSHFFFVLGQVGSSALPPCVCLSTHVRISRPACLTLPDGGTYVPGSYRPIDQAALHSALPGKGPAKGIRKPLLQHPLIVFVVQVALQHLVHVEALAKSIRRQAAAKEKAVAEASAEGAASAQGPAQGEPLRRTLSHSGIMVRECCHEMRMEHSPHLITQILPEALTMFKVLWT